MTVVNSTLSGNFAGQLGGAIATFGSATLTHVTIAGNTAKVGGGINMGPNAVRVLHRLGLGPGLDRDGVRPLFTHQRRWQDGSTLQKSPLNPLCEQLYGAPHMTFHRRDLLAVIATGLPSERTVVE